MIHLQLKIPVFYARIDGEKLYINFKIKLNLPKIPFPPKLFVYYKPGCGILLGAYRLPKISVQSANYNIKINILP